MISYFKSSFFSLFLQMINLLGADAITWASFISPDVQPNSEPAILELDITYMFSGAKYDFWNVDYLRARIKLLLCSFTTKFGIKFKQVLKRLGSIELQFIRLKPIFSLKPPTPYNSAYHPNLSYCPTLSINCFPVCIYYLTVGDHATFTFVAPETREVLGTELALNMFL